MPAIDPSRLLTAVNPKLAAEWHPTKNIVLSLETVYAGSSKKAWWQCSTCGYQWEAVVSSRNRGRGCSYCAGKIPNETNSLVSLHPEIAAQYSSRNTLPVETLTRISHKKVWWNCPDNSNHEWEAMVQNRVRQGDGCPYCSGRYATKENNLAVTYPQLAEEFNLEKNYPLTPYDVTPSSHKVVWWCCNKTHEWERQVDGRVKDGVIMKCPYCVGKKASSDNNLLLTHPEIAKQYHPSKNTVPVTEIRYGSTVKRWWICATNHVWEAQVAARTSQSKPSGCPECSPTPRTSKVEHSIRAAVKDSNILTDIQETYNAFITTDCNKQMAVDMLGNANGKSVVIEYDSWWWHSGAGRQSRDRTTTYEMSAERDIVKTQALLSSGFIVIRIREVTAKERLPLLQIEHKNLFQIQWKQTEGLPTLIEKINEKLR